MGDDPYAGWVLIVVDAQKGFDERRAPVGLLVSNLPDRQLGKTTGACSAGGGRARVGVRE